MNYKKFLDKPFRLMALIGCIYLIAMLLLNIFTDISLKNLKEANNTNKKIFNNIFEIKGDNDKEKKIKFKNKAILL